MELSIEQNSLGFNNSPFLICGEFSVIINYEFFVIAHQVRFQNNVFYTITRFFQRNGTFRLSYSNEFSIENPEIPIINFFLEEYEDLIILIEEGIAKTLVRSEYPYSKRLSILEAFLPYWDLDDPKKVLENPIILSQVPAESGLKKAFFQCNPELVGNSEIELIFEV